MLFKPLALAAVATSFVIIPKISDHDEGIFRALPIEGLPSAETYSIPHTAFEQSISVPCSDCRGKHPHLRLDFTVEDETRLLLNGFELYPDPDPFSGDLKATVVKGHHRATKSQKLGYSLAVYPKAPAKDDFMELIEMDLKIIEVGTRFVDGVPPIKVRLVKGPGGSIMMSTVNFDRPAEPHCTSIKCRTKEWISKLWSQAQKMKGCGKRPVHGSHPEQGATKASESTMAEAGHSHGETEPHPPPPRKEWRHLVKRIINHIIMPMVVGFSAGVAIASLAMCIHAVARSVAKRISTKRNCSVRDDATKSSQHEVATMEEKAQLIE